MKYLISVFFLTILSGFYFGQTRTDQPEMNSVDREVLQFMKTWNIPGGAVTITKNNKPVYSKGFGYSDLEKTKTVNANSLFRLASVSKPITALAVMKLAEEGKINLDDSVFGKNKILSDAYYLSVISDKRIYGITVKNLLEHTAGWDRDMPCDGFDHSDAPFFPLHVTEAEHAPNPVGDSTLIRFLLRKGLNYSPGKLFSYSNIGYLVLGKVIEKVSEKKYEDYVTENILKPGGIADMHLGKNFLDQKLENEVEYFCDNKDISCYGNGKKVACAYGSFNLEAMNAHGGWVGSAPDLCKLLVSMDEILSSGSLAEMKKSSPCNPYYAKGWSVNGKNCWHTGSLDGTATFICKTSDGYTWAFLFNARADNSEKFWNAFDRLPWKCVKAIEIANATAASGPRIEANYSN